MAQNVNPIDAGGSKDPITTTSSSASTMAEVEEAEMPTSSIGRNMTYNGGGKHSVTKRLQKELLTLMTCGDKGISAFPDSDYMFKWTGTIHGPDATVYEGLVYKLSLEFPSSYPYAPPTVRFVTQCFHPNVDHQSGNICLDILKEKWSALYDVRAILLSIQSLLGEPNNESPLNSQAADLWSNPEAFKKRLNEKSRTTTTKV